MPDLSRPLRRSREHRMVAGVVGGLAEYLGIDPTLLRVVYVLVSILTVAVPGIFLYVLLWAIMPKAEAEGGQRADLSRPLRRSREHRMVAGVVGGLADYLGVDPTLLRVFYVIVSIASIAFPGILVYLVLWVVIPQGEGGAPV